MSALRAAVVGYGWAGEQHAAAYAAHPEVELVAVAGKEPDRAATFRTAFGPLTTYEDWTTLLTHERIDVLSVATPTFLHAPITIAALDAGVHVLCEKPLAESLALGQDMVHAARRNDRVLQVCFNHRRRGEIAVVADAVARGLLGEVYYAKAGWVRRTGIPGGGSWFTQQRLSGGGALADIGVHMLDAALHCLQEPAVESVTAATYAQFGPHGRGFSAYGLAPDTALPFDVEDLATAFLRLAGGGTLLLEASWAQAVPADRCHLELYGSKGSAVAQWGGVGAGRFESVQVSTEIEGLPARVEFDVPPHGAHAGVVAEFVRAVASGEGFSDAEGAQALTRSAVLEACYASAESRGQVSIG